MISTILQHDYLWTTLSVAFVVGSVVAYMFCGFCKRQNSGYPPGKYGLPLFGVLPSLGTQGQRTIKKWSLDSFGPIFYLKMGSYYEISLNTVKTIKEALLDNDNITSGRPEYVIFNQESGISFLDDTDFFRNQKKFGMDFLHSIASNGKLEEIINAEGDIFLDHIAATQGPIDLANSSYFLSGNILSVILMGQKFDYQDDNSFLALMQKRYGNKFKLVGAIAIMPWLRHFPCFSGPYAAYQERKDFIEGIIGKSIQQHEEDFNENQLNDFIDYFVKEQRCGDDAAGKSFTNRQLKIYVYDLYGAGIQNAAITLLWMVLCALRNPECHKQVVEEIDKVLGKDKIPLWEDRLKLPYTRAFIDEVLRIVSPLQKTVSHKISVPLNIEEFTLPKDTRIYGNIWGAHHDPQTWQDPENFDPKRFLNDDGEYAPSPDLIPFGVGARSCIAENLAHIEIFIMFVRILQRFTVEGTGQLPTIYEGVETVTYDPPPFKVVLKNRV